MNNLVGVILDVAKNSSKGRSILTKVSKDAARALDNLSGVALSVELAETAPFTKGLALRDLNEGNVVLLAESLNEAGVSGLIAIVSEAAKTSSLSVEGLDGNTETTLETIVVHGVLQDLLKSGHEVHGLSDGLGLGGGFSNRSSISSFLSHCILVSLEVFL